MPQKQFTQLEKGVTCKCGRLRLTVVICAGFIALSAIASRAIIARQLEVEGANDLREIIGELQAAPPPPLREIATLSPYEIESDYSLMEVGGPERAASTFTHRHLGLEVQVAIHTCRPRVISGHGRTGEINLVDGSNEDLCTSGGLMIIVDTTSGEEFQIQFKLIGSPGGTLGWNARQFVSLRTEHELWRDSLQKLRDELPQSTLSDFPPTIHEADGVITARQAATPNDLLMSGDAEAMRRLLQFRGTFREFYEHPDTPQAQQVARILIDTLLESPMQQEMSEKWIEELGEAG